MNGTLEHGIVHGAERALGTEAARLRQIENALVGLDVATATRLLEFVRSRVMTGDVGK